MNSETFDRITDRLEKGTITGKALLSRFRLLDETSRESPAYSDTRYAPFYYILGQELPAKNLLEMGFRLGICSGCYLRGCRTVEHFLAFQEVGKSYYSPRLGIHNVKDYFKGDLDVYIGAVTDHKFTSKLEAREWDLAIVNEEREYDTHLAYLELIWSNLAFDGTVVMDYVTHHKASETAYQDFCRRKGKKPQVIPTKYGVGVITK
jgi:hypothetical protein